MQGLATVTTVVSAALANSEAKLASEAFDKAQLVQAYVGDTHDKKAHQLLEAIYHQQAATNMLLRAIVSQVARDPFTDKEPVDDDKNPVLQMMKRLRDDDAA